MMNIARTLAQSVRDMVPGRFEAVAAAPDTHPHVNWTAYARTRGAAEALGFKHLGDIDPVSVTLAAFTKRVVLAVYVSEDGTEVLGHYRFAFRWTLQGLLARLKFGDLDYFDVTTHFGGDDGVSLQTTNAEAAGVWSTPSFLLRQTLKRGTQLKDVLARHRQRIAKYRAGHPDVQPMVVRTLAECNAMSDVSEQRKLAWRRAFGWASKDEIGRVTKTRGATLDQLYDAFRRHVMEEPQVPTPPSIAEPTAAPAAPRTSGLQFDRVDLGSPAPRASKATMACASCTMPIAEQYFDVDGRSVCVDCKEKAVHENEPARGIGPFLKALVFGGIAAVIGAAIYYAFAAFLHIEWAVVTIVIGLMVGAGIRRGTQGKGGRRFQVMAVFLTYFAVGLAFTPFAVQGIMQSGNVDSTGAADTAAVAQGESLGVLRALPPLPIPPSSPDSASVQQASRDRDVARDSAAAALDSLGAGGMAAGLGIAFIAAIVGVLLLPLLAVFSTLPSGILTAVIVGFGLVQAWKMTAAAVHTVSGPYRVGDAASSGGTRPAESPTT